MAAKQALGRLRTPARAAGRVVTRRATGGGGFVLAYHDVVADGVALPNEWTVSARQLRGHLRVARALGFRFVPLSALVARAVSGLSVDGLVAIAFDDALAGVHHVAAPILNEASVPACLMTPSTSWGSPPAWWPGSARLMTRRELTEAVDHGFEIAAHTRTHPSLPTLDAVGLRDEIAGCRDELSALVSSEIDTFAYPFGHFDEKVRDAVREAGYRVAFTFLNGRIQQTDDRLRLPRLTMGAHMSGARLAYHLSRRADSWPEHQVPSVHPVTAND